MRILVVDDSVTMRKIHTNCLQALGYDDVVYAETGAEALEQLDASINLILLDWHMPEMTGIQFLERVKSDPEFAAIPVIMVSSERSRPQIIKALTAGVKSYIIKPFAPELLQDRILEAASDGAGPARIAAATDEFKGSLKLMRVPEIIQFLSHGTKSGVLRIESGGKMYLLNFSDGEIANAEGPGCRDKDVVYEVVKLREGDFNFRTEQAGFERRIGRPTSVILLDSLRRADEDKRERP